VRCVPAAWVVPLPAVVEFDMAAAVLLKGLTADVLLRDLSHVRPERLRVFRSGLGRESWQPATGN